MLRKIAVLLATLLMALMMSMPMALMMSMPMALAEGKADPKCGDVLTATCEGHQLDDGADKNLGGGNDKVIKSRPPHAGGDQHGGGL